MPQKASVGAGNVVKCPSNYRSAWEWGWQKSCRFCGKSMGVGMLREYRRGGNWGCGDSTAMEFVFAGTPQGCFKNLTNNKNLGTSVRIL